MPVVIALVVYTLALISGNLLASHFGPSVTPYVAFCIIGLDLSLRDWLHVRVHHWQMAALILAAGGASYLLDPSTRGIAIASCIAFIVSGFADWLTFLALNGSWLRRSIGSNVVGAAVDSLVFPTLAFGGLLPMIVLAQFVAKTIGGAFWAYLLSRIAPDLTRSHAAAK